MRENHLLSSSKTLTSKPNFFPYCVAMLSSFLFIRWRKEKEKTEDDEMVIRFSLQGSLEGASH